MLEWQLPAFLSILLCSCWLQVLLIWSCCCWFCCVLCVYAKWQVLAGTVMSGIPFQSSWLYQNLPLLSLSNLFFLFCGAWQLSQPTRRMYPSTQRQWLACLIILPSNQHHNWLLKGDWLPEIDDKLAFAGWSAKFCDRRKGGLSNARVPGWLLFCVCFVLIKVLSVYGKHSHIYGEEGSWLLETAMGLQRIIPISLLNQRSAG